MTRLHCAVITLMYWLLHACCLCNGIEIRCLHVADCDCVLIMPCHLTVPRRSDASRFGTGIELGKLDQRNGLDDFSASFSASLLARRFWRRVLRPLAAKDLREVLFYFPLVYVCRYLYLLRPRMRCQTVVCRCFLHKACRCEHMFIGV